MPLFSIIIPTYNRSSILIKTVNAFLRQNFLDFEIIIVDDGSSDNTKEEVLKIEDPRLRYFYKENGERGAARNFGAMHSKGQYLNFFDSDDTPFDNHLSNASQFIESHNNPPIFHVGYTIVDVDGKIILTESKFNYDITKRLIKTNFLGCNSVFVKREIFIQNQFNENRILASSEDWEIWLRLSSRYPMLSCDTITYQMNNHADRSLHTISPYTILERDTLLIDLLMKDQPFVTKYKRKINAFTADRYTFFALIFSLTKKHRVKTLDFLLKAIYIYPCVIFEKRFWATIKHIV